VSLIEQLWNVEIRGERPSRVSGRKPWHNRRRWQ
jgi:hypothetical protein